MMFVTRYSASAIFAGFITFSLFFLMQILVAERDQLDLDTTPMKKVVIFKATKPETPPPPPGPEEVIEQPDLPPAPPIPKGDPGTGVLPDFPGIPDPGDDVLVTGSSEPILITPFMPVYPQRALMAEKEGYALIEFTVTAQGTVTNPVLIDEDPKGFGFGPTAMKAILKFRYEPKVVGGQAVAVQGMREQFLFELPEE